MCGVPKSPVLRQVAWELLLALLMSLLYSMSVTVHHQFQQQPSVVVEVSGMLHVLWQVLADLKFM